MILVCVCIAILIMILLTPKYYENFSSSIVDSTNIKSYVIHCPGAPQERVYNVQTQLNKLSHKYPYEIIDCITKSDIMASKLPISNNMTILEVACYFSHLKTFHRIRNEPKQYLYSFVFEDDFDVSSMFSQQVEYYLKYMQQNVIDFDIIMLSPFMDNLNVIPSKNSPLHIINDLYKYHDKFYFVSTAGYIVNNKNIHNIIECLKYSNHTVAYDHKLNLEAKHGNLSIYYIYPRLVNIQPYQSTLGNKDLWGNTHV